MENAMTMTKTNPNPVIEKPDHHDLARWLAENRGCPATDGCWVAIEGRCEHGHVSWLRYLGFIAPDPSESDWTYSGKIYSVRDVQGVYSDAFVSDRAGSLLFASFWGRDTAINDLMARLSLKVSEGGLSSVHLIDPDDPSFSRELSVGNVENFEKITGRMPASNLFGAMTQLWLFDRLAVEPVYGERKGLRICRVEGAEDADPCKQEIDSKLTWNLLNEVSPLPLLDDWRGPVIEEARNRSWITFHPGVGINALALRLPEGEYEPTIEAMIQAGILKLLEVESPESRFSPGPEVPEDLKKLEPIGRRLTAEQLEYDLRRFAGTELWYRHSLVREMTYTDGVKYFAKEGGGQGAYWFLDIIATEVFPILKREPFLSLILTVKETEAELSVDDGNGKILQEKTIPFTDLQEGIWRFYLTDNVLLLPSEY
jgi:hypothetical protein